jgi:hypothetical protein
MDTIVFSHNTRVTVGPPTAHPLADGLIAALSPFLSHYPEVSRGFLEPNFLGRAA